VADGISMWLAAKKIQALFLPQPAPQVPVKALRSNHRSSLEQDDVLSRMMCSMPETARMWPRRTVVFLVVLPRNEFGDSGQTKRMGLMAGHNSIQRSPVSSPIMRRNLFPILSSQRSNPHCYTPPSLKSIKISNLYGMPTT